MYIHLCKHTGVHVSKKLLFFYLGFSSTSFMYSSKNTKYSWNSMQCMLIWGTWSSKSDTLPTSSAAVLRHLVTALRLISYWKHCWSLSEQLHAVISSFACSSYINMHLFLLKFLTLLTRESAWVNCQWQWSSWSQNSYTLYEWSDFHKNIWIDEIFYDSHDSLSLVLEILLVRSKLSSAVVRIRNRISQRGP